MHWMKKKQYQDSFKNELPKLEIVYVDKLGNNWYKFTNFFDLRAKRGIEAHRAHQHADMCMTPAELDIHLQKIKDFIDKGKYSDVAGVVREMEVRRTRAAEETTLQSLANCYFLLDGEDPFDTSMEYLEKKKAIWGQDPDCYAFFLNTAFLTIRNLSDLSDTGIVDYLREKAIQDGVSTLTNPS